MIYTSAIFGTLRLYTPVSDIIGKDIFPIDAPPEFPLPFATYEVTGERVQRTKEGSAVQYVRIEVAGYESTFALCVTLGRAIKQAILKHAPGKVTDEGDIIGSKFEGMEVERIEDPEGFVCVCDFELMLTYED